MVLGFSLQCSFIIELRPAPSDQLLVEKLPDGKWIYWSQWPFTSCSRGCQGVTLSDMFPGGSGGDHSDAVSVDSKLASQCRRVPFPIFTANLTNLIFGQFGLRMSFAFKTRNSSFNSGIPHVAFVSVHKKMIGIPASRVVASMANFHSRRYSTSMNYPRSPIRSDRFGLVHQRSVPTLISASRPDEAWSVKRAGLDNCFLTQSFEQSLFWKRDPNRTSGAIAAHCDFVEVFHNDSMPRCHFRVN